MKMLGIGLCGECASCAGVSSGNAPGLNQSTNSKLEFTYDEGEGTKDTIVMDGPLSNVYTQALNVYFAKKPIEIEDYDSLSKAFESAAIDAILSQSLIENKNEEDTDEAIIINNLNIVPANMDIVQSPKAIIYATAAKKETIDKEIEVIEATHDRVKNAGKDFIVFIGPELGSDGQVGEVMDWVDFSNVSKINAFNISDKFSRATESFFETRGIQVAVGFEKLVEWLKTQAKE